MRPRSVLFKLRPITVLSFVIVGLCLFIGQRVFANAVCPFCSAVALTFTQQIDEKEVAIVAKMIEEPTPPAADSFDFPDGKFEIVGVLKGDKIVKNGMTFTTQVVGVYPVGQKFLVMGQGAPDISWSTPVKATDRVFEYLQEIQKLPESGVERLVFLQDYFEDKEKILAFDAYDEFAAAPYSDLLEMKEQMKREKLLEFIKSPKTTVDRRRLYFTMLGVCGQPEDATMLEGLIKSDSRKQQAGLDALVGCYLTLVGKKGLPLISEKFLANKKADYVDLTNVMDALRFHAAETDVLPIDEIVPVVRTVLDHPEHADIVIEDLARWGDWTVMKKLVKRFKEQDESSTWERVPIFAYMLECPKPEAAKYLEELKAIDPRAFKRASFYHNIGGTDDDAGWGDDDDWGDNSSPKADANDAQDSKVENEAPDESETVPKTDSATAPPETSLIFDDKVKTALAEVASVVEDVDVSENRIELAQSSEALAHASEAQQLADDPSAVVDARLANAYIATPEAEIATPTETTNNGATNSPSVTEPDTNSLPEPDRDPSTQVAAVSVGASADQDLTQTSASTSLILKVLFIPMGASFLILGLMWSVVNGWFERLIF